ncbi:recombinase family protein [Halosimplex pelagicum]|nr:recombinase family protein [Halosimplex pelagicum]
MYGLARERKWPNDRPPLGYEKNDDGTLCVDETEKELVRLIFDLYIQERSMPQVSFLLNRRGKTTKRGDSWCRQSVGKVLRNELYIGHYQIADFQATVEEYQILPDAVFDEATAIRFRFKHAQTGMDSSRKQSKAERIINEYRAHQNGDLS